jgi:serine/threonine protein kinase
MDEGVSQFQQLEELFHQLDGLSADERRLRLDSLAESNPRLYAEYRALQGVSATRVDAVEAMAEDGDQWFDGVQQHPQQIGPYRIVRELGRGGMGQVYAAEQTEPVRRQVALKVARNSIQSDGARARFRAERQALAVLDHPNIAKVFDAGSTDSGQLWFAMELVDGVPITRWADEHALGLRARIELFLQVCDAVQHAHQKGLIHRDLKPSNLLVQDQDGQPMIRVIDFGIAKVLQADDLDQREATRQGEAIGTPQYMSPEQATLGEVDIDTRSDVYGLGLVLHALMTGRLPIDDDTLNQASFGELCRRVREDSVTAPSRLEVPEDHPIDPRALRGDLDLVLLKALAKDREQRYSSAQALGEDLRRVLACEPISAAPPRLRYRMNKFIRRHRLPVGLAAVAGFGLVVLTGVALWQADLAETQRDRAQIEAQRSAAVVEFLQNMLASADPAQAQGQSLTVDDVLDQARTALPASELDLEARAAVEETLATTYAGLGRPEEGLPLAQQASERLRQALGPDHPLTLSAQHAEARFYLYLGRFEEAAQLLERTLEGRERVLGAHMDTASTMHNLAYAWAELGDIERALDLDRRQLRIVERLAGADSQEALVTASSIAQGLGLLERYAESEAEYERILQGYRRYLGERHPNTLSVMHNLAYLARIQDELELAEERYVEVVALRREVLGSEHLQTINSIVNLGSLYLDQERWSLAVPLIEESLERRTELLGEEHPDTLGVRVQRLRLAAQSDEPGDWLQEAERTLGLSLRVLGDDDALTERVRELREHWMESHHE